MRTAAGSSGRDYLSPAHYAGWVSRRIALTLAVLALGSGVYGLISLSPEMWGVGLIGFGCLLAIISVLAQAAEHFARAAAE
jgi:hypothetical protein